MKERERAVKSEACKSKTLSQENLPASRGRVLVAMSGGVDSSVAAYLLKEQGYEVTGATMQIWQDQPEGDRDRCDRGCCSLSAVEDARRVARKLDIPYYVLNFKEDFRRDVIHPFVQSYWEGETPNPCILCNRYVKFERLLDKAKALGFDWIATGHYGRIVRRGGRVHLGLSATVEKDQSYALYTLTEDQLEHLLLPLGDLHKDEVRSLAQKAGLPVANKPDSQEICFVPDGDYAHFVETFSMQKAEPGNFILEDGRVIGQHKGLIHYTIGQRKGLGIAWEHPLFVQELRTETNEVVLGPNRDLFRRGLIANDLAGASLPDIHEPIRVRAKVRYRASAEAATLYPLGGGEVGVIFDEPQRALTPGQAVVCYKEDFVLGGATILSPQVPSQILKRWALGDASR